VVKLKYWELVEDIKQLRRDGHTARAGAMLFKCIEAIEAEHTCPAPWYFEQLAIMFRKEGNFAHEVQILVRYMLACERVGEAPFAEMEARLLKARALAAKAAS
jgi:hypothetical protein